MHPLFLSVACTVHPEGQGSDLMCPHKTLRMRDQTRTRCQRTRNCFICKPKLGLALIQLFYICKSMKHGLKVSRVCEHVFQVLASRQYCRK
jgi:hypothetical protein